MNENNIKVNDIQREIEMLLNKLSSNSSDIGNWKINKIYEYRMQGKDNPYDFDELCKKRQETRDRINELQNELEILYRSNE